MTSDAVDVLLVLGAVALAVLVVLVSSQWRGPSRWRRGKR